MKRFFALIVVFLVTGCSQIPVSVDFDPEHRFDPYQTFYWLGASVSQTERSIYDNELIAGRIESAVAKAMTEVGITPSDSLSTADLKVSYQLVVEERLALDHGLSFHTGYGMRHGGIGLGVFDATTTPYKTATLAINIRDKATDKLVWRGLTERRLPQFSNPEEQNAFFSETVAALMARFPPSSSPERKAGQSS